MSTFLSWLGESLGLISPSKERVAERQEKEHDQVITLILSSNCPLVLFPVDHWHSIHLELYGTTLPYYLGHDVIMKKLLQPHYIKKVLILDAVFDEFGFHGMRCLMMRFFVEMLNMRKVRHEEYMAFHWRTGGWRFIDRDPYTEYAILDTKSRILSAPGYRCGIMGLKEEVNIPGMRFQPPL